MYYTRHQVSELAGVERNTFYNHVKVGKIPKPTVPIGRRMAYTEEAKDAILEFYKSWEPWGCMRKDHWKEANA